MGDYTEGSSDFPGKGLSFHCIRIHYHYLRPGFPGVPSRRPSPPRAEQMKVEVRRKIDGERKWGEKKKKYLPLSSTHQTQDQLTPDFSSLTSSLAVQKLFIFFLVFSGLLGWIPKDTFLCVHLIVHVLKEVDSFGTVELSSCEGENK